jgi:hypothetical protein
MLLPRNFDGPGTPPMSASAKSLFVFGLYSILLGTAIMTVPNTLFSIFGLPPVTDVWIRVAGMLLFCLGIYYCLGGWNNVAMLVEWSVYTRASVILFFGLFVVLGLVQPVILALGVIDLAAAIWTALALRTERMSPKSEKAFAAYGK